MEFEIHPKDLDEIEAIPLSYTKGNHPLEIAEVALVADGQVIAEGAHLSPTGSSMTDTSIVLRFLKILKQPMAYPFA